MRQVPLLAGPVLSPLFPSSHRRQRPEGADLHQSGNSRRIGTLQHRSAAIPANWSKRKRHPSNLLAGSRILVVENDHLIATDLVYLIEETGASVIGPGSNVAAAWRLISKAGEPSAAILDIRLDYELAFAIVDTLLELGIPLVLYSAFECQLLPERFEGVRFVSKSLPPYQAIRALQIEMAVDKAECRDLLADNEPEESVVRITVALLEIARSLTGNHEAASMLVEAALNQALKCSGMRPSGTTIFRWLLQMVEDAWISNRWLH